LVFDTQIMPDPVSISFFKVLSVNQSRSLNI
jgi:hypothetical protein